MAGRPACEPVPHPLYSPAPGQTLASGIDPGEARKAGKLAQGGADSFDAIAREWHAKFSPNWVASHGDRIMRRFEKDLFPWVGKRPMVEIKAPKTHLDLVLDPSDAAVAK